MDHFKTQKIKSIREQVGDKHVICGLSGGVDSSVVAVLLHEAIGDQLTCVFVDHGLLRLNEAKQVVELFQDHYHIKLIHKDASKLFLGRLKGIEDPEEKRKIIGKSFIEVFEEEVRGSYVASTCLPPFVFFLPGRSAPASLLMELVLDGRQSLVFL